MDYAKESLRLHYEWKGKLEVTPRATVNNKEELSLAYTPGVAQPCLEIQKDISKSYELTRRWNTVAVITDGTAVLGLGDIGPEAGMPVMEGKCVLFKAFGGVLPAAVGKGGRYRAITNKRHAYSQRNPVDYQAHDYKHEAHKSYCRCYQSGSVEFFCFTFYHFNSPDKNICGRCRVKHLNAAIILSHYSEFVNSVFIFLLQYLFIGGGY